ncbi:MAG: type II toxin-antitoxin system ParD family antitoxin [Verrucomicrobiales bacterium]
MNVTVPAPLETFIQSQIEAGRFESINEVIAAGLALLQSQAEEDLAGIREGIEDYDQGRFSPLDVTFQRLEARYKA